MPGISFAECSSELVPVVQEFFARMYRPDYVLATDERLLRWQFGGTASGSAYHIKLGLVDGLLAACLGYIPVDVSVDGHTLRGAWTANWIVDPSRRSLALGPLLMRDLVRQHDVTLVVGASSAAREILPRLGFTALGELRRHVCVIDPAATAGLTASDTEQWLRLRAREESQGTAQPSGERVERFGSAADRLWDTLWGSDGAGTRRSATFLNWRYVEHPTFQYRLFEARDSRGVTGVAVYRIENVRSMSMRIGRVVEFVSAAGCEAGLLRALLHDARSEGIALLDLFCSSNRIAPVLHSNGWVPEYVLPAGIPVLFQPPVRDRRGIPFLGYLRKSQASADIDRWYVTKGDGDQDRPN